MTKDEIISWLVQEFSPIRLATQEDTLSQIVDNAIRYWNTHSGYKISAMYDYSEAGKRVQISPQFKTVVSVYPNSITNTVTVNFPTTLLLGMSVIDSNTTDLVLMSESFKTYKSYLGLQFTWTYEKSEDPTVGGYLYAINVPSGATKLYVVGTKRILENEDIKQEYILDFVLYYSKALLKMVEGNTLRKGDIIGAKNDGQEMYNEGKEEKKELEEKLSKDGRWVALASRC
jgi:hypothetical protein